MEEDSATRKPHTLVGEPRNLHNPLEAEKNKYGDPSGAYAPRTLHDGPKPQSNIGRLTRTTTTHPSHKSEDNYAF